MSTAAERFTQALINLRDRGQTPPCRRSQLTRDYWTSDNAEERAYAAASCGMCPVLADCHAAAVEANERFGVWAGVDRTQTRTPRKDSAA